MNLFRPAKQNTNRTAKPVTRVQAVPVQPLESRRLLSAVPASVIPLRMMDGSTGAAVIQMPRTMMSSDMVTAYLNFTGTPGGSTFPPISAGPADQVSFRSEFNHFFGGDNEPGNFGARDVSAVELPPFYSGLINNPVLMGSGTTDGSITTASVTTAAAADIKITNSDVATADVEFNQTGGSAASTISAAALSTQAQLTTATLSAADSADMAVAKFDADPGVAKVIAPMATDAPNNSPANIAMNLPTVRDIQGRLNVFTETQATGVAAADTQSILHTIEADMASVTEMASNMVSELVRGIAIDLGHHEFTALGDALVGPSTFNWQSWQSATAITGAVVAAVAYLKSEAEPGEKKTIFGNNLISTDAGWQS